MRFRVFFPLIFVLSVVSCTRDKVDPGLYLVCESGSITGVVDVVPSTGQDPVPLFYPNEHLLASEWVPAQVAQSSGHANLTLGSKTRRVDLIPYDFPDFNPRQKSPLYLDSLYQVKVRSEEKYGTAKGFWTSYPDTHEGPVAVYWRKFKDILWQQIAKDVRKDLDLTMDIYYPVDGGAPGTGRPLLLLIHGGAFLNGDKALEEEAMVGWANYFASLGYVVASMNYRCGFLPTTNEVNRAGYRAVQDANAAVRYLLQDKSLAIDPNLVFVAGASSGAITALNLAFMEESDRPSITSDSSSRYGDEGAIGSIMPPDTMSFTVRAVGNLWGAVSDTSILANRNVPVISFQSVNDPVVPYDTGTPFPNLFDNSLIGSISDAIRSLVSNPMSRLVSGLLPISVSPAEVSDWLNEIKVKPFPTMYGSYVIDRVLRNRNIRSELHSYSDQRHSLHLDASDRIIRNRFNEIRDGMKVFFSSEMAPHPVALHQDPDDPQVFRIDGTDVAECSWKVEGGVILDQGSDWIRVLMLKNRMHKDNKVFSVMVTGEYSSRPMTFFETVEPELN